MRLPVSAVAAFVLLWACSEPTHEQGATDAPSEVESAANTSAGMPPLAGPAVPAATRVSTYTKMDEANCRLIDENKEESPYWSRLCPGHAGWSMEWSESDLRQGITLIDADGKRRELGLSSVVANGAFNSIAPTIEWRGATSAKPDALILRMNVAAGPDGDRPDVSWLVVVRLTEPACVVKIVPPGSGQNARAHQVADGALPPCLSAD